MKKLYRILILTCIVAAAFGLTAFADGWTQDTRGWQYLKGSRPVSNEWALDSNGDYFYLGGDGYMAVSQIVDTDRYVDSTGRMVKNAWRQIDGKWYYFESTGRMVQGKKKQIENLWYYFDYDGTMVTGWYNDGADWYYCDEQNGAMITNTWKKLEPAEEMGESSDGMDEGLSWFYFQAAGKAARATDGEAREFTIGGNRFAFDTCGRMQTGWTKIADVYPAIAGYKYYNDTESLGVYGAAHSGWLSAYAPEELNSSSDVDWYWFDSKGNPAYGTRKTSNALDATLKKITKNGTTYSYLFNENGNPVYGLQKVISSDGSETTMYFGTKSQSCLQKGTSVVEGDGTVCKYAFTTSGAGITGVKNGYLYYKGKIQKAEDDTKAYFDVDGHTWLVNQSGYVLKNYNKNKKAGEVEYRSDANGYKDGGTAPTSKVVEPVYQDED